MSPRVLSSMPNDAPFLNGESNALLGAPPLISPAQRGTVPRTPAPSGARAVSYLCTSFRSPDGQVTIEGNEDGSEGGSPSGDPRRGGPGDHRPGSRRHQDPGHRG